ncbi:fibrinogen-like protein A [Littorina saxatilis]|uniref:fibrinogen-like protein A n=1 Tax=Littorina saxatilis TaxID=31220 RepID=UPI0038B47E85
MGLALLHMFVIFLGLHDVVKGSEAIKSALYGVCPKGLILKDDDHMQQFTASSNVECVARCSDSAGCHGVNVCPGELGQVSCTLTGKSSPGGCDGLTDAPSPLCFHVQNVPEISTEAPTTTEVECQNGGTPAGTRCDCPAQYSGTNCQRYIRDCSEPYANGVRSPEGVYFIQPVSSAQPFRVYCNFVWGGLTYVLRRTDTSNFNQNWTVLKDEGIGQNPSVFDYFAGLENMHHLTKQATYQLTLMLFSPLLPGHPVVYDNFTVGAESTSYAISYTFHEPNVHFNDLFSALKPVKFSASDNDVNNCYGQKGMAGWYGTDCAGYTLFSNGAFNWPDKQATDQWITRLDFRFVRQSGDYV